MDTAVQEQKCPFFIHRIYYAYRICPRFCSSIITTAQCRFLQPPKIKNEIIYAFTEASATFFYEP